MFQEGGGSQPAVLAAERGTDRTLSCRKLNSLEIQGTGTKGQPSIWDASGLRIVASSLGPKSPHIVTLSLGPLYLIGASTSPA